MNKRVLITMLIAGAALFLGLTAGLTANTQYVEKVVEKPINTDTQELTKKWHELKKTDDFIFTIAGETMSSCAESVSAAASADWDELEKQTKIVDINNAIIEEQTEKRKQLLNELGYKENGN